MNVFIINLPQSKDRRVFQENQLARLMLDYTFLDAVSIHDISDAQYEAQGFGWQRPLKKVELACFLSHKKAWEMVSQTNKAALILEDDAVLVTNIKNILFELEHSFKDHQPDLINLEVRSRKKIIGKMPVYSSKELKYNLFELFQERTGTGGYILFPTGAKKLLDKTKRVAPATADAFIFSTYELNAYQIEPAALIQEDQMPIYGLVAHEQFESVIGRSEHFKPEYKSIVEKLSFKKRRLMGQLAMAIRYVQVMGKAKKRLIRLNRDQF
ncbi:glycosyltransferase family 25 protein [Acinetobacter towneri]|uniref:glycosyltransferase family 25 protein n=1 Tax=Acinetobacter towneri TaxID=202956 RepID=UPI00188AD712|nr:glycosyltransferase family 25 protein [Acinetobacter towneri]MBF4520037.1 glycosyltransferase family 25 protein [Acinetobacter towneri]MDM1721928.1 glycosyltransferase family 25 protein [Acinetobacter towneri]